MLIRPILTLFVYFVPPPPLLVLFQAGAFNNKRGADFHFPKKTFFVSNKPGQSDLKNERRTSFEHMLDILNCEKEVRHIVHIVLFLVC